jgi:hypothetical protein
MYPLFGFVLLPKIILEPSRLLDIELNKELK